MPSPAQDDAALRLTYQPRIDLNTRRVTGLVVAAGRDQLGRTVHPDDDFAVARDRGMQLPIGQWLLRNACRQAAQWRAAGHELAVAVGVPVTDLYASAFCGNVLAGLAETGLDAGYLDLEIPSAVSLRNPPAMSPVLATLRAAGVRLTLSEFGTGLLSFSELARLPVTAFKIDRALVREIATGGAAEGAIAAVVAVARRLAVTVIAAGVENQRQCDALQKLGCDQAEGVHFGHPQSSEELARFLAALPACATPRRARAH